MQCQKDVCIFFLSPDGQDNVSYTSECIKATIARGQKWSMQECCISAFSYVYLLFWLKSANAIILLLHVACYSLFNAAVHTSFHKFHVDVSCWGNTIDFLWMLLATRGNDTG